VDPRAGLDDVEKRKFLTLLGFKLRPLGRAARSQSLYRLHYPGSCRGVARQSQSHIATDGQSVSLGLEPRLGLMTRYLLLFDCYGLVFVVRPLSQEDGSIIYMLLVHASAVFLRSESLGTRDHILLSQI
jgi:hypothetical protein